MVAGDLDRRGWQRFAATSARRAWARHARRAALGWLETGDTAPVWRCGGTWSPGVDALDNDESGAVAGSGPLPRPKAPPSGAPGLATLPLHKGQLSVLRPGYPQPWDGESPAAFRFRQSRDGAHLDGLLPIGPERRRMLREPHAFILGLPLNDTDPGASPLVVWEGSHRILQDAIGAALAPHAPAAWPDIDLTATYQAARRRCFETCRRVPLHAAPGEALLLHRALLHGMAPWEDGAAAPPEGRIVAYFRPQIGHRLWLSDT